MDALRVLDAERVLKTYTSRRKRDQALRFFREVPIEGVPRVLEVRPRSLVLSRLPGASSASPEAHRLAGRWLRGLHDLPCPSDDPMPLPAALDRRMHAALRDVEAHWRAPIRRRWTPPQGTRVWCHRDFHPRNWLLSGQALAVVDFEHSRPDHPLVDLVRVPNLVGLLETYGPVDPDALAQVRLLHAVQTRAWGLRNGDTAFSEEGLRLLQAALA